MRRRTLLLAGALGGCSILPQRPYQARRDWPLAAPPPAELPPRPGGRVLLIRTLRAAPGMEARGLQVLQPDGSVQVAFYEEWSVPPADAVEDALRRWLAASGLFAAITAPGSRLPADLALEGELLTLVADPQRGTSTMALALTLIDLHPSTARVKLQLALRQTAPLANADPAAVAASGRAALAAVLAEAQRRIASVGAS